MKSVSEKSCTYAESVADKPVTWEVSVVSRSIETRTRSPNVAHCWALVNMLASQANKLVFLRKGRAWCRATVGLSLADTDGVSAAQRAPGVYQLSCSENLSRIEHVLFQGWISPELGESKGSMSHKGDSKVKHLHDENFTRTKIESVARGSMTEYQTNINMQSTLHEVCRGRPRNHARNAIHCMMGVS